MQDGWLILFAALAYAATLTAIVALITAHLVHVMLMFPNADVSVVQLSIQRHFDPAQHVALGAAISSLRDEFGVLVFGSGGTVHPLGYAAASLGEGAATDESACDSRWLTDAVTRGDRLSLVKYRATGIFPARCTVMKLVIDLARRYHIGIQHPSVLDPPAPE